MTREGRNFTGELSDLVVEGETDDGCKVDLEYKGESGNAWQAFEEPKDTKADRGMNEGCKETCDPVVGAREG